MEVNLAQIFVSVVLSSGFVGGFFALLTKRMTSPESRNDLARLGNEFAHQLLQDARTEREELRLTINELEDIVTKKHDTIERLKHLAREKDLVIKELEHRLIVLAEKINSGQTITLKDIFGEKAPNAIINADTEII